MIHTSFFYDFEIVYFSAIFYKTDSRKTGDEKPVVAELVSIGTRFSNGHCALCYGCDAIAPALCCDVWFVYCFVCARATIKSFTVCSGCGCGWPSALYWIEPNIIKCGWWWWCSANIAKRTIYCSVAIYSLPSTLDHTQLHRHTCMWLHMRAYFNTGCIWTERHRPVVYKTNLNS